MAKKKSSTCPCGSGLEYSQCCGCYIDASEVPQRPEQLMRSRYTAYTQQNDTYILDTWHSSTRPSSLSAENKLPVKWTDLQIVNASDVSDIDTTAAVEFIARYKVNGKSEKMHERSEFVKEAGRWFYLKGEVG